MEQLILVRHAHARSNGDDVTSCTPPGGSLTATGRAQADVLRDALAGEPIALGASSRLARTRQTLDLVLAGKDVPRVTMPELDEIHFGSFEGRAVSDYRGWAWTAAAHALCPGGGESRSELAARTARALSLLLDRPEPVVLAVGHALPIRYVLDAAVDMVPAARMTKVPHAEPFRLERDGVDRARRVLARWASSPHFRE